MKNNPLELFGKWLKEAKEKEPTDPLNMIMATAGEGAIPSARVMKLSGHDNSGFYFCTSAASNKAKEISANKNVAGCFYWDKSARQVRIEGGTEIVGGSDADRFFTNLPRSEQLLFWASKQSAIIENDGDFEHRLATFAQQFSEQDIPLPPHFLCFRIVPEAIEFWQDKKYRLHKRELYTKTRNGWSVSILFP